MLDLLYATCLRIHTFFNCFLHGFLFSVPHGHIRLSVDANRIFRRSYRVCIVIVRTSFSFHTHASRHGQLHLTLIFRHPHGIATRLWLILLLHHLLLLSGLVVLHGRISVAHHAAEACGDRACHAPNATADATHYRLINLLLLLSLLPSRVCQIIINVRMVTIVWIWS